MKFQRGFISEEKITCLCFRIEWACKLGKTFVSNSFNMQMTIGRRTQELATVQTVGDAPIHALLDVCLDFYSVRSSRTSPSGGHFDRAV